jgi:hypothetical protein
MSHFLKAGLEQDELEFTTFTSKKTVKSKLNYPGKEITAPKWGKTIPEHINYVVWAFTTSYPAYARWRDYANDYQLRNPGHGFGSTLITEVLRYHSSKRIEGDIFKINNNLRPVYARIYLLEYPNAPLEIRKSWLNVLSKAEWQTIINAWEAAKDGTNA